MKTNIERLNNNEIYSIYQIINQIIPNELV